MVSPGRRTDGRAPVLNKLPDSKNIRGAQGRKILCLSSMACLVLAGVVFGGVSAQAQNPVYSSSRSADTTAQMEIRLQQMETQLRELTGRLEQQTYDINQLRLQIKTLQNTGPSVAPSLGASQIAPPIRDPAANQGSPLNLDFKPQQASGMKTAVPGGGSVDPTGQYEQAYASLKNERYTEAQRGFEGFLSDHGDHVLAPNAKYWLGETYYVRGDYKQATRIFAEGFKTFPDSAKSPDILLKLGMSLAGMGKEEQACVALSQLSVKFPNGPEPVLHRGEQEMKKLGCGA